MEMNITPVITPSFLWTGVQKGMVPLKLRLNGKDKKQVASRFSGSFLKYNIVHAQQKSVQMLAELTSSAKIDSKRKCK